MPSKTHFPSGPIKVENAQVTDISAGMNWDMTDASNVRFLSVSGILWIGDCRTSYDFTLVEYELVIDEVPWKLFSTLNDALENEFEADFWTKVNPGRKERWGFHELPWGRSAYDVSVPYTEVCMSIFDELANTVRVVKPFIYRDTYLRVHPNGAAIFAEMKKLAFLLPLIIEVHGLLPPTPLFWVNDDQTIPLRRTTLWTHPRTIQWLVDTKETYPHQLKSEIQPRIDQLRGTQPAKRVQPPPPPRPTRWEVRSKEPQATQATQEPVSQDPRQAQTAQPSPIQTADRERQYMELQAMFDKMKKRVSAESRPKHPMQPQTPATASASSPPTAGGTHASLPPEAGSNEAMPDAAQPSNQRPDKLSAQLLANQRPEPPTLPATHAPNKMDAPGTGELSTQSSVPIEPKLRHPSNQEQQAGNQDSTADSVTPTDSPTESPDSLDTATAVASSPEPAGDPVQEEALATTDLPTLQKMHRAASQRVDALTTQLDTARDNLSRIAKRIKIVQDNQPPDTSPPCLIVEIDTELMDMD